MEQRLIKTGQRVVIIVCLMLGWCLNAFSETVEVNGIWYELNSADHTATVVVNPSNHGFHYYEAEADLYYYKGDVVVPSSVTWQSVSYTVTAIGAHAFSYCQQMTSIQLPVTITKVGDQAFDRCHSLKEITLPDGITTLSNYLFYDCRSLERINLPASATSFAHFTFYDLPSLQQLTISSDSKTYQTLDGVLFSKDLSTLYVFPAGRTGSYTVPDGVKTIGTNAFRIAHITSVILPETVQKLDSYSFEGSSLTTIHLPASLNNINYMAWVFMGCKSLTHFTVADDNPSFAAYNGQLYNKDLTTLYKYPEGQKEWLSLSPTVTTTWEDALCNLSFKTIRLPETLKTLGFGTFQGSKELEEVYLPDSLETIEQAVFTNCTALRSIRVPASVKYMQRPFDNCQSLQELLLECADIKNTTNDYDQNKNPYSSVLSNGLPDDCSVYAHQSEIPLISQVWRGKLYNIDAAYGIVDISAYLTSISFKTSCNPKYPAANQLVATVDGTPLTANSDGLYEIKGLEFDSKHTISLAWDDTNGHQVVSSEISTYPTSGLNIYLSLRDGTTQTKAVLRINESSSNSNILSHSTITDRCIYVEGTRYEVDQKRYCTVTGLLPGHRYSCYAYYEIDGKGIEFSKNYSFTTHSLSPRIEGEAGLTTIYCKGDYTHEDAEIEEMGFEGYDSTEGTLLLTGLQPGSSRTVTFYVRAKGCDTAEKITRTFTTKSGDITLVTQKVRAASNTTAIMRAETNLENRAAVCGFEWRRCDAPEIMPSEETECPVYEGALESRISGLSANTYYQYRPFYHTANSQKIYGEWIAFLTADAYVSFPPTIHTFADANVTLNKVTVAGYVLAGSDDIAEQGFEYWISTRPEEVQKVTAVGQRMSADLTDFADGTTYTYRAYLKTVKGEKYEGEEQTFTTLGTSSVEFVVRETKPQPFNVYTMSGKMVLHQVLTLEGLPRGIYIVNRRKVMVR